MSDGHHYIVDGQEIQFRCDPIEGTNQEALNGILCQDLIRVLMDRVHFLNRQQPAAENIEILDHLKGALVAFETRALRRKIEKHPHPELIPKGTDGHIFGLNI